MSGSAVFQDSLRAEQCKGPTFFNSIVCRSHQWSQFKYRSGAKGPQMFGFCWLQGSNLASSMCDIIAVSSWTPLIKQLRHAPVKAVQGLQGPLMFEVLYIANETPLHRHGIISQELHGSLCNNLWHVGSYQHESADVGPSMPSSPRERLCLNCSCTQNNKQHNISTHVISECFLIQIP